MLIKVLASVCSISLLAIASSVYAHNTASNHPLSLEQVSAMVQQVNTENKWKISVTPEVVAEVNRLRSSDDGRMFVRTSLKRMKLYQPVIQASLQEHAMPTDLLALPMVQSAFQPLTAQENPVSAAGIWQIIPDTATKFGLVVTNDRDDRLNTELSTKVAVSYLEKLYAKFNDWNLALVAYEIGEEHTSELINKFGTRNAWELVRADAASKQPQYKGLGKYLAQLSASVIILHNPSIMDDKA